ncbi:MAG: formate acetyltransferase [Promethearchaeota archaeon]|nr:MAG: formate acetyltransferase [Candidatus Lokiarchaeota archaeon]
MASVSYFKFGMHLMALKFRFSPKFREEIYIPEEDYAFNVVMRITTRSEDTNIYIKFHNGKMKVLKHHPNPDTTLVYRNKETMAYAATISADQSLDMLLSGDLYYIGSLSHLSKFSYLSTIFPTKPKKKLSKNFPHSSRITEEQEKVKKIKNLTLNKKVDDVQYLNDPYLGKYKISDFPWLEEKKNEWFSTHAYFCSERAKIITKFFKQEGFEKKKDGTEWQPGERQGLMLKYLLSNKTPRIFEGDLIPGSTTSKKLGVLLYPEFGGIGMWPELATMQNRELNPYHIKKDDAELLNKYVFPFWMDRNIRELARSHYNNPQSQRAEEFFSLYFEWKTQAISHTIPNFNTILDNGLDAFIESFKPRITNEVDETKKKYYIGMKSALEGIKIYGENLKIEAQKQIDELTQRDPENKHLVQLLEIKNALEQIPGKPPRNFREAITSLWIIWVCLHQENMNAGLSFGRLDQVLNPYFLKDMEKLGTEEEREEYIKEVMNLIGAFYLKAQDHLPMVPNVGNKLFGGSSSDQALTLGGITPDGKNAVNDLTFIFLKVTELLAIRDPNVNAKYHPNMNSVEYLARLCEVNINTTSTPSIHNDKLMIETIQKVHGFTEMDANNWAATGCVEPTSVGKHFGHTGCLMVNLVAPLEMLFGNGYHPLIHPQVGLTTGEFNQENFPTFKTVVQGYKDQLAFMIAQTVEYNNNCGVMHQKFHPTPLLSTMIEDCIISATDVVDGGAKYNSTGAALVAVTDVIDSLYAIKKLVYENKIIGLSELKTVLDRNFSTEEDKVLLERIRHLPKFGSGSDAEIMDLAHELIDFMYTEYYQHENYRGGKYVVGFWSMSNHSAFGKLSGALPSGRLRGKAFTPGITPSAGSSDELIQNIKTIASIDHLKMPNNMAFNVKLVPGPNDSHETAVKHFTNYTKSYFDLSGLQIQFNVVTSDMLRDAMVHPENYRWLMIRVSGYNAYFISLNKTMQMELVERYQFK